MSTPDLGYITVKTTIEYYFFTGTQEYMAKIGIWIPMDNDGLLPIVCRNNKVKIFHSCLFNNWGAEIENYRVIHFNITDPELNTLQSVAYDVLKDQMETLEAVTLANRKAIAKLPSNPFQEDRVM